MANVMRLTQAQNQMANHRFRYGLTSCLVLLAFFSILLPWLTSQRSLRLRHGRAMNTLQQSSSGYGYYAGLDENDSTWIEKFLHDWFGKRIRTVRWHGTKINDLTVLTQIDNLRELFIMNSEIVDLSPIADIESIRLIELTGSTVTDLTPLQYLPNLKYLNVHRTPLTDEQVNDFARANPGCNILHPSVQTK